MNRISIPQNNKPQSRALDKMYFDYIRQNKTIAAIHGELKRKRLVASTRASI